MTQSITEPARAIPVVRNVDVLVVGGGIAGVSAAVCAARQGAKTLLVERYGYLGGITVAWPVPIVFQYGKPGEYYVQGIAREIVDRLDALGGWQGPEETQKTHQHADGRFDTELLKLMLMEMCREADVELLLHSTLSDTVTEHSTVKGIVVDNKSGRQAVLATCTVDATGDGDVAALAGARSLPKLNSDAADPEGGTIGHCSFGGSIEGLDRQSAKRMRDEDPELYAILQKKLSVDSAGLLMFNMKGDAVDVWDLTRMEQEGSQGMLEALRILHKERPAVGHKVNYVATQFGVRLGRRIAGVKTLTREKAKSCAIDGDEVCVFASNVGSAGIPFGCLVPESVDGVVIGSRSISVDENTFGAIRLIGTAFGLGEAAGTAAALAVKAGVQPRDLDVGRLRATLKSNGALIGDPT